VNTITITFGDRSYLVWESYGKECWLLDCELRRLGTGGLLLGGMGKHVCGRLTFVLHCLYYEATHCAVCHS